ncbi:MAG: hypothetical protein K8S27_15895 [Candidatus Omnitrophica bacterium]|nr:hypothetical protein [Candidatus Omnitrophota bacterium]
MNMLKQFFMSFFVIVLLASCPIGDVCAAASSNNSSARFSWQYSYDNKGRMTTIINPAKQITKIRYTENQRGHVTGLTQELPNDPKVKHKFDKYGRRVEMVDGAGTVRYVYDKFDRLSRVQRDGQPPIIYKYDTLDRIKSIRVGMHFEIEYEYDYLGRTKKMKTPAGTILFSFNSKDASVSRRLPNGISTQWEHGPDGRLSSIAHSYSDNRSLARYHFTYRQDGLMTTIKELTPTGVQARNYKYDLSQRLIGETENNQQVVGFDYDKFGNRTMVKQPKSKPASAQYNWMGQLIKYNGQSCQHDKAGNLTTCAGSSKLFEYTDLGLLKSALSNVRTKIKYEYNGDGFLIQRTHGSAKQTFIPNPFSDIWQPLVARDSQGQETYYIWDGPTLIMTITGHQVQYYLHDHLGSVRLVTDQRGEILERLDYTPYGKHKVSAKGGNLQPGFAGLFFDQDADLYLTRARAYDPVLGRFLQPDPQHRVPLGSQKDLSVYAYCGGDAINYVDRNGFAPEFVYDWWKEQRHWQLPHATLDTNIREVKSHAEGVLNKNIAKLATMAYPTPIVQTAHYMFKSIKHLSTLPDYRSRNIQNAYDLSTKTKNASFVIKSLALINPAISTFGAAALLDTSVVIGNSIRSRNIQNRNMNMIRLPLGERTASARGSETLDRFSGYSQMSGESFSASSAWSLNKYMDQVELHSYSNSWAKLELNRYYQLSSGTQILGTFNWAERRDETSNSLWRKSSRRFSGRVVRNGLALSRAVDEYNRTGNFNPHNWESTVSGPLGSSEAQLNNKLPDYSGFNDSKVGGIRLAGAGNALNHLGGLEGIAIDKTNGRLVLIAQGERPVNLPPLRLDDVVTVFRSVYHFGEAPSVTIDPKSNKKNEKAMVVRHGSATKNTYVGWVLYEADRVMKTYQLGRDNRTKKPVYSKDPLYRDFYKNSRVSGKKNWERFWIVPASQTRTQSSAADLTVLDVPLKLETEPMKWDGTKLVTDKKRKPSKAAKNYQDWFTARYGAIAKEVRLKPPKHCGFDEPVAVFEELRRIALITGIAETLRDQNLPFPAWMKDYPVKPCLCDEETPILKVQKKNISLAGGVQLAVKDKDIIVMEADPTSTQLAQITQNKISAKPVLTSVSFQHKGKKYDAVSIPGSNTINIGANIMFHTDLEIDAAQSTGIALTRQFNSFYDPRSVFGRGWTLDLPKLDTLRQPVSHTEEGSTYKTVFELSSPLNSWSARFSEVKIVPEYNREMFVPNDTQDMVGLFDTKNEITGAPVRELVFRDGKRCQFDEDGYFIGRFDQKSMVAYTRDKKHNIVSIKSWSSNKFAAGNKTPDAELQLTYDEAINRVRLITAHFLNNKTPDKAYYFYNENGQLDRVIASGGNKKYTYRNGLISGYSKNDEPKTSFEYNEQGQIVKEHRADGVKVAYKRTTTTYGTKVAAINPETDQAIETVEYDADFQPLRQIFEDGSNVAWKKTNKTLETTITQSNGDYAVMTDSAENRRRTIKTSADVSYTSEYDQAGRLVKSHREEGPTLEQKWDSKGQLRSSISDDHGLLPQYNGEGHLTGLIVTPPDQARTQQVREYVKTDYNDRGMITKISDDSGAETQIEYDQSGFPVVLRSQRGMVTFDRDSKGRIQEVETTWGDREKYDYDQQTGNLRKITLQQHGQGQPLEEASIEMDKNGQLSKVILSDGATTEFGYFQKGKQEGLLKKVQTPNQLALSYDYDASSRLTDIAIGADQGPPAYRIKYNYDSRGRMTGISYALNSSK